MSITLKMSDICESPWSHFKGKSAQCSADLLTHFVVDSILKSNSVRKSRKI